MCNLLGDAQKNVVVLGDHGNHANHATHVKVGYAQEQVKFILFNRVATFFLREAI